VRGMRELKQQLVGALLVIVTVAAAVAAAINFQQQGKFHLPDDGVTWVDQVTPDQADTPMQPVAVLVAPRSAGEKAGIHVGDVLVSINGLHIDSSVQATEVLARLGAWSKAEYRIVHGGIEAPATVYVAEAERDSNLFYLYGAGALYLLIGLFVYFR